MMTRSARRSGLLAATVVATTVWMAPAQAGFLVDEFLSGEQTSTDNDSIFDQPITTAQVTGGTDITGDVWRTVTADRVSGPGSATMTGGVNPAAGGGSGRLTISEDDEVQGSVHVRWDGEQVGDGGFAAQDLTTAGSSIDLAVALINTDGTAAGAEISLTLIDSSANSFTVTKSVTTNTPGAAENLTYAFSDFTGVDATMVVAIEMLVDLSDPNSVDGTDIAIDFVGAVPEPGTIGILGLGLLAVGAVSRRRRTRS